MEQVGQMVTPTRCTELNNLKMFPTLNLFDPISIKAWLKMRLILNNYSERWMARHSVTTTYAFLYLICLICYSLLLIFRLIHYGDYRDDCLLLTISADILCVTVYMLVVIAEKSRINNAQKVQFMKVWFARQMIGELFRYKSKYFANDFDDMLDAQDNHGSGTHRTPFGGAGKSRKEEIQNPLYHQLAAEALKIWPEKKRLESGMSQLLLFYNRMYEAMKHQEKYTYRTIIGQKVTKRTFASFSALLISGLLIALQGLTKKRN